jgi:hypothetical protein
VLSLVVLEFLSKVDGIADIGGDTATDAHIFLCLEDAFLLG